MHKQQFVLILCDGLGISWARHAVIDNGSKSKFIGDYPGILILSQCRGRELTFSSPNRGIS